MVSDFSQSLATPLGSYVIASADMYYSEQDRRVVYVRDDPENGFQIWGEIPTSGSISAVNLCEILLEYAMTCNAMCDPSQAVRQMEIFGDRLGRMLACHIRDTMPVEKTTHLAACGLECIIESLGVNFTVEQDEIELRFILDSCPVSTTAERTGLRHVKLARDGMKCLCHSLTHAIDPDLIVNTPVESDVKQVFSVKFPANLN
jgi:hypothetical protein